MSRCVMRCLSIVGVLCSLVHRWPSLQFGLLQWRQHCRGTLWRPAWSHSDARYQGAIARASALVPSPSRNMRATNRPSSSRAEPRADIDVTVSLQKAILNASNVAEVVDIADCGLAWFDCIHSTTCLYKLRDFAMRGSLTQTAVDDIASCGALRALLEFHENALTKSWLGGKRGDQAIGNSALALGTLSPLMPQVSELSEPLAALATERVLAMQGVVGVRDISNLVYGFAASRQKSSRIDMLFRNAAVALTNQISFANAQDMANAIWAYAMYGLHDARVNSFFAAVATEAPKKSGQFTHQGICITVWGFARMEKRHVGLMTSLGTEVSDMLQKRSYNVGVRGEMVHSLSDIMFAFAQLRVDNQRLLTDIAIAVARHPDMFDTNDVATIFWAFARLDFKCIDAIDVLVARAGELGRQFGNWGLCAMLWAVESLKCADRYPKFSQDLQKGVRRRSLTNEDVERSGLGPMGWADEHS